jgi:hypothetical protein
VAARVRNSQNSSRGSRPFIRMQQLADACRIDVREPRKIQENAAVATAQKRLHAAAQVSTQGRSKSTVDFNSRKL